jgi:hypothetical protein
MNYISPEKEAGVEISPRRQVWEDQLVRDKLVNLTGNWLMND